MLTGKRNGKALLAFIFTLILAFSGVCPAESAYAGGISTELTFQNENTAPALKLSKKKKKNKNKKSSSAAESREAGSQEGAGSSGDEKSIADSADTESASEELKVEEDGSYTSKEEVALYIHTYNRLPGNYITKKEAEELGWQSSKGNLWEVAPGKSIGGSYFGNYEGLLPDKKGRKYYECDIDFDGAYRNAKRIIYSNDGLIFYTQDHYKTFEQLY